VKKVKEPGENTDKSTGLEREGIKPFLARVRVDVVPRRR
jgi:hypothetical protein